VFNSDVYDHWANPIAAGNASRERPARLRAVLNVRAGLLFTVYGSAITESVTGALWRLRHVTRS
jgi:hypothetical protein